MVSEGGLDLFCDAVEAMLVVRNSMRGSAMTMSTDEFEIWTIISDFTYPLYSNHAKSYGIIKWVMLHRLALHQNDRMPIELPPVTKTREIYWIIYRPNGTPDNPMKTSTNTSKPT